MEKKNLKNQLTIIRIQIHERIVGWKGRALIDKSPTRQIIQPLELIGTQATRHAGKIALQVIGILLLLLLRKHAIQLVIYRLVLLQVSGRVATRCHGTQ